VRVLLDEDVALKIGIPKEIFPGELRVAGTPATVKKLIASGHQVLVEAGAGVAAGYPDEGFRAAGASVVSPEAVWGDADIVTKIRPPGHLGSGGGARDEVALLREGGTLVSFIWPAQSPDLVKSLAMRRANVFAMDQVPRITRAQKLDALSSMANLTGYRAVIEAAAAYGSPFTGQVTAAGKIPPAKVLVIGAGVAGLAALGTAKSLGAIVRAFDTRPAVREQIQSMGAEFLMLDFKEDGTGQGGYAKTMSPEFIAAEMALFATQAKDVDIIITTALIPGKPAPKLLIADTVRLMKPGSVIVDLAAEQGGNCEFTVPGKAVTKDGVTIIGYTDLASRMAIQASQLYGTNIVHFMDVLCPKGQWNLNLQDEILRGSIVLEGGELRWPPPAPAAVSAPASAAVSTPAPAKAAPAARTGGHGHGATSKPQISLLATSLILAGIIALGAVTPASFLSHFTVFVLACFIGYQVVWNVTAALHTPLMSVTNAISGIIVIGAMVQLTPDWSQPANWISGVAVLLATINIAGGFLVTQRMLKMFRK